jgi:hypothetical protein
MVSEASSSIAGRSWKSRAVQLIAARKQSEDKKGPRKTCPSKIHL